MVASDEAPPVSVPAGFVSLASGDAMLRLLAAPGGGSARARLERYFVTAWGPALQVGTSGRGRAAGACARVSRAEMMCTGLAALAHCGGDSGRSHSADPLQRP